MKKVLMIIGSIVIGIVVLAVVMISVVSLTSKKLVCKSSEGNITIMYNDDTLTAHIANNIAFDLDSQKAVAEKLGIDEYLEQFSTWFSTNTSGTCTR